jgi:magnesium transporter
MLRAYLRQDDRLVATDIDVTTDSAMADAAVWFNLTDPTKAEDQFVESCLGIDIPTRAEMDDIEPSARLYNEDGAEFMTITALVNSDTDEPMKTPITFVLRNNQLVTVRYADPKPFRLFERLCTRPTANTYTTGERVMLGLIEAIVDRLAQLLETTGDEIDQISREVFRNKTKNVTRKARDLQELIERIGKKGDILTLARESLVSITRLSSYHQTVESDTKPARELRLELKVLQRDAAALSDHAAFLSNKINFLLDATLGLINLEQNQIIKIFSVAAVVFLPPTLVASVYGMNFDILPELHLGFGYPLALGMMVASAILPYLFFKRRGWL